MGLSFILLLLFPVIISCNSPTAQKQEDKESATSSRFFRVDWIFHCAVWVIICWNDKFVLWFIFLSLLQADSHLQVSVIVVSIRRHVECNVIVLHEYVSKIPSSLIAIWVWENRHEALTIIRADLASRDERVFIFNSEIVDYIERVENSENNRLVCFIYLIALLIKVTNFSCAM